VDNRKAKVARKPTANVFNEHTDENGATVLPHPCKLGFEGIVSKGLQSRTGGPIPGADKDQRAQPTGRASDAIPGEAFRRLYADCNLSITLLAPLLSRGFNNLAKLV